MGEQRSWEIKQHSSPILMAKHSLSTGRTSMNLRKLGLVPLVEQKAKNKATTFCNVKNRLHKTRFNSNWRTNRQSEYQTYSMPASGINSLLCSFFQSTKTLRKKMPLLAKCSRNLETFKNALQLTDSGNNNRAESIRKLEEEEEEEQLTHSYADIMQNVKARWNRCCASVSESWEK